MCTFARSKNENNKKMIRKILMACLLGAAATSLYAQTAPKPKLTVVILLEQERYNDFIACSSNFRENGLKKLIDDGTFFTEAWYGHPITSTLSSAATVMTGSNPSRHGIVGERWMNYTTNGIEQAANFNGIYSPQQMNVSTLGDELKTSDPESKVFSVAFTPSRAIIPGGAKADFAFWVDTVSGNWGSSAYYGTVIPQWVTDFNNRKVCMDALNRPWIPSLSKKAYIYPPYVLNFNPIQNVTTKLFTPRHTNFSQFEETPNGNHFVSLFAKELIVKEELGKDFHRDLLVISFGGARNIAAKFGSRSAESEDALYKLDEEIGSILDLLDMQVGKENYAVVVTAAGGACEDILDDPKNRGNWFNKTQFRMVLNGFLNTQYGVGNWITAYENGSLYLNRRLIYENKLDLIEVQNKTANFALQFQGVASATAANAVNGAYFSDELKQRHQNRYNQVRSGDVLISLLPNWVEMDVDEVKEVSVACSAYDYDVHVPLLFYGKGIRAQRSDEKVSMTDIAPTLSELMGVPVPNLSTGKSMVKQLAE